MTWIFCLSIVCGYHKTSLHTSAPQRTRSRWPHSFSPAKDDQWKHQEMAPIPQNTFITNGYCPSRKFKRWRIPVTSKLSEVWHARYLQFNNTKEYGISRTRKKYCWIRKYKSFLFHSFTELFALVCTDVSELSDEKTSDRKTRGGKIPQRINMFNMLNSMNYVTGFCHE